jgi:two-component system, sensor histidine kinase and response regulator
VLSLVQRRSSQPSKPDEAVIDDRTKAFLAAIVESSDDSIVATDLDGRILTWNAASERMWGYAAGEAVGKHISILYPEERRHEYQVALDNFLRRESIQRFEAVRSRKDGSLIDVSVILSGVHDSTGRMQGISAMYRDITSNKQAEAELLRAKEAAEAANQAKSQFLANMSHEIRTPMNGILGMLDLALELELAEELRDYLETAHASASALLAILNDVLDFSKIEAGRMELEETVFSVPALVDESLKSLAVVAAKKGLTLRQEVAADVPLILLGDPTRLRQVLLNLLNNAMKFTDNGSIAICAAVDSADAESTFVRFSVQDTGIGISPAQQQRIFDAFSQADGSITRRYGGTGLGLSISHRIVEMMGGRLSVASAPGQGSTFSFTARLRRAT